MAEISIKIASRRRRSRFRLFGLGHFSIQASDQQRAAALDFAESIIVGLREQFSSEPAVLAGIDRAIENARKFYAAYGGLGRDFMFSRGLVDPWGAELDPQVTSSKGTGALRGWHREF